MVARTQTIDTAISSLRTFLSSSIASAPSTPIRAATAIAPNNAIPRLSDSQNETMTRLKQIEHSSVSQNIAELLLFSTTGPIIKTAVNEDRVGRVRGLLRQGGEVGAKELARAGLVGGQNQDSRRFELSL